ncbi:sugar O-acyltransferase, sialic acid O-acetyltransferase NeuD family [Salegentibacter agarivorans]|uniref:Sugar O-acyltransferase, sialic acid O-acetyltransferase NeuD family n=1 Tax=Salegentibacter agarivorans TaxID=345907 RepID=A0A1I2JZL8_9FLAO|nr:acetyltransferase [Salegentibacter agarivorans]SFF60315.1 sugar O-acyltransferase, sialic acid O-acetyltransferase NeuD family [Salegentibacter agarivorans]
MKENKKLVIYGVGKFADFIIYSFIHDSPYQVVAQCVEEAYISEISETDHEFPLVNFDNLEKEFNPDEYYLFITVGNDKLRERIYKKARKKGYTLATYIATNAIYPKNLKTGNNVYIGEKTGIQPFVEIENNSFIIAANIGHHSKIGKNSLLSVCLLGAEVQVGKNTFIGLNATIKPKIKIGSFNIIGMNSKITSNTPDHAIFSEPATKIHKLSYKDISGKYL